MFNRHQHAPTILLLVCATLTAAVYWPGLRGPMLFDDYWNLAPVSKWLLGDSTALAAMLPNADSIIFSRPVSMASFMLTTWLDGSTFGLKLGNLIVHIACGLVVWRVLRLAFLADDRLRPYAEWAGAIAASIWLLHPLHVSTVLYGVQRMAQLAAFFSLCAVWAYLALRSQGEKASRMRQLVVLFLIVPLLCLAGLMSKQNAAVTPLMCLALEVAYFSASKRSREVTAFFLLSVMVPAVGTIALLIFLPGKLLGGYDELEFTVYQRLLTEPRVLLDYLSVWLVPNTPSMGLYTDGYPISTGWWTPPSTALAIGALLAISVAATALRRRSPSLFAGWFLFLAAHAVESTILPLEIYYEHRNYLPSIGLLVLMAGVLALAATVIRAGSPRMRGIAFAGTAAMLLILAYSTLGRVLVWQSEYAMTEQGLRHRPESLRVRLDRLSLELTARDYSAATQTLQPMMESADPRARLVGYMDAVALDCLESKSPRLHLLERAMRETQSRITVYEVHSGLLLEAVTRDGSCGGLNLPAAAAISRIVDKAIDQSDSSSNKTTLRRVSAQLYARAERWDLAAEQAEMGWRGAQTLPLGSMLVRSYMKTGRPAEADRILTQMEARVRSFDRAWLGELQGLRRIVDNVLAVPPA